MKNLTTLLALLLSCSMLAQGPVEFPWNPDADGDDFIGVNDLMALLGEFDSAFSEEALYLSEDSLSAMYDAGDMKFVQCQVACHNLPGTWKMPRLREVIVAGQEMWLETPESAYYWTNSWDLHLLTPDGRVDRTPANNNAVGCFCVTKERPKVEYSYCDGPNIQDCAAEKAQDGWYPLGGISTHENLGYGTNYTVNSGYTHHSQAFWRWAE